VEENAIFIGLVSAGLKQEQECKTIVGRQKEEEEEEKGVLIDIINAGL
jgi:hypothetical protein